MTAGTGSQPSVQLRFEFSSAPGWLLLEGSERPEIALRFEKEFDRRPTRGPNQFLFEVVDTHEESELPHLSPALRGTEALSHQTTPKEPFFAGVAHPRDPKVLSSRAEFAENARYGLGPSDRDDHDPLCRKISPLTPGQRFECHLVADPLDQHDRPGGLRPGKGGDGGLDRSVGSTWVAMESFESQPATLRRVHEV